jgi:RNase P subunit RPR2
MYVSGERAGCVRRVMLQKGFACHNCGSVSFIVKDARWSTTSPLALEVASNCASCGTAATTPLSLEEARRCAFDDPKQGL